MYIMDGQYCASRDLAPCRASNRVLEGTRRLLGGQLRKQGVEGVGCGGVVNGILIRRDDIKQHLLGRPGGARTHEASGAAAHLSFLSLSFEPSGFFPADFFFFLS